MHPIPKVNRYYRGTILFCHAQRAGWPVMIRARFAKLNVSELHAESFVRFRKTKPGNIYRFEGTYRMCKNGAHQFSGKVRRVVV